MLKQKDHLWNARYNQLMVLRLDTNNDGVVSKEEFMEGFAGLSKHSFLLCQLVAIFNFHFLQLLLRVVVEL